MARHTEAAASPRLRARRCLASKTCSTESAESPSPFRSPASDSSTRKAGSAAG